MKFIILGLFTVLASASYDHPPLSTVNYVDLDKYLGKWYEIARFEHNFQKGCTATTAEYIKNKDKTLKVINKCRIGTPEGEEKKAIGRAWVVDQETNAKLKVQFFLRWIRLNFLAGDYWVLELDDDYEYAVVGSPDRQYLWILARKNELDEALYLDLVQRAEKQGFDTSKLIKTNHKTF